MTHHQLILIISIYVLIGIRFAFKFVGQSHIGRWHAMEIFDYAIGSIFVVAIWPLMIVARLLRE